MPKIATPKHLIVKALAGTGKTTTLVSGLKQLKGLPITFTPSTQQQAIFDAICESKKSSTVLFVAFNKSIAEELKKRVPEGCEASTLHSAGSSLLRIYYKNVYLKVNGDYCVFNHICKILGKDYKDLMKENKVLMYATREIVGLCKMNLVGMNLSVSSPEWYDLITGIALQYDIDMNSSVDAIVALVPKVLEACKDPLKSREIDFNDMIWLPVVHNMEPSKQYDILLVDEAQDLNACQQALALCLGKRIILCGDEHQAIYGFAGADSESMNNMEKRLENLGGVEVLPLTTTYRCGKQIVERAKKYVPAYEAYHANPEGEIKTAILESESPCEGLYENMVKPGDMVLCRVNAPLVSECFKMIRRGIKAVVQGRDIAANLIKYIEKTMKGLETDSAASIVEFISRMDNDLSQQRDKLLALKVVPEAKLAALQDKRDCLMCFTDEAQSVSEMIGSINKMFSDDSVNAIKYSSIHKSKGLEANTVFFINNKKFACPHPMAKTPTAIAQETNLLYVAETRAINTLVLVS